MLLKIILQICTYKYVLIDHKSKIYNKYTMNDAWCYNDNILLHY